MRKRNVEGEAVDGNLLAVAASRHRQGGRREEALALLRPLLLHMPGHGFALNQLGLLLAAAGDGAGVAYLARAIKVDPEAADWHADYAEALEISNDPRSALRMFRRGTTIDPARGSCARRLGLALVRRGQLPAGRNWLRRALALDEADASAFFALGYIEQSVGNLAGAANAYRMAAQAKPDFAEAYVLLAKCLKESGSEPAEIAAALRPAVARLPGSREVVVPYAELGLWSGNPEPSEALMRRLIDTEMVAAAANKVGRLGFRILSPAEWIIRYIGETAFQLHLHVKMKMLGWLPPMTSILLVPPSTPVANRSFLDYWRQHVVVVDDPVLVERLQSLLPGIGIDPMYPKMPNGEVLFKQRAVYPVQREWERQGRGPLLSLTEAHGRRGHECLRALGVPEGAWFVCVHVREAGFGKERAGAAAQVRNADIRDYLPAIREITRRGGWVVRLGDPSVTPLPAMEQVIDYAQSDLRSDWMDIFLAASGRFFLGTSSGMAVVSSVFGVPTAAANFYPPGERMPETANVLIPKLIKDTKTGRILDFGEMLSMPLALTYDGAALVEMGLEVVDSTAEDILDLTIEMLDRGDYRASYSPEDDAHQQRWNRLARSVAQGDFGCRIGRGFLRRHAHLFPKDA